MIAIIDYGAGNLRSVANAVRKVGYRPEITKNPQDILDATAVVFPGVGAAPDTMDSLQSLHLIDVIKQRIHQKKPLLSICIGLQILFSQTEEGDCHKCLGIFPGDVKKLPPALKIPHIGWNQVKQTISHSVFEGIPDNTNFYFVHSYYAEPQDASIIAGTTDYGKTFCSMIIKDNLLATQFHPERSGEYGLRIYANFLNRAMDGE